MKRSVVLGLLLLFAICALVVRSRIVGRSSSGGEIGVEATKDEHGGRSTTSETYKPFTPETVPPKPKLYRYLQYPPTTKEGEAMWQWWRAMNRKNPQFEDSMPLEFYGIVLSQDREPVSNVNIRVRIAGPRGDETRELATSSSGRFEIEKTKGSMVSVEILGKEGCYPISGSRVRSFWTTRFFEKSFYIPDKDSPVEFLVHCVLDADPVYVFRSKLIAPIGAESDWLDVSTGRVSSSGDICFSAIQTGGNEQRGGLKLLMRCANGVGVVPATECYSFKAPSTGYSPEYLYRTKEERSVEYKGVFVRNREGKYSYIEVDTVDRENSINVFVWTVFNPSGSENLEIDQRKVINP